MLRGTIIRSRDTLAALVTVYNTSADYFLLSLSIDLSASPGIVACVVSWHSMLSLSRTADSIRPAGSMAGASASITRAPAAHPKGKAMTAKDFFGPRVNKKPQTSAASGDSKPQEKKGVAFLPRRTIFAFVTKL